MIVLVNPRATRPGNRRFPLSVMAIGAALPEGESWEIVDGNRPDIDVTATIAVHVEARRGTADPVRAIAFTVMARTRSAVPRRASTCTAMVAVTSMSGRLPSTISQSSPSGQGGTDRHHRRSVGWPPTTRRGLEIVDGNRPDIDVTATIAVHVEARRGTADPVRAITVKAMARTESAVPASSLGYAPRCGGNLVRPVASAISLALEQEEIVVGNRPDIDVRHHRSACRSAARRSRSGARHRLHRDAWACWPMRRVALRHAPRWWR